MHGKAHLGKGETEVKSDSTGNSAESNQETPAEVDVAREVGSCTTGKINHLLECMRGGLGGTSAREKQSQNGHRARSRTHDQQESAS